MYIYTLHTSQVYYIRVYQLLIDYLTEFSISFTDTAMGLVLYLKDRCFEQLLKNLS